MSKDDPEALRMLREATTRPNHRPKADESSSNLTTSEPERGTTKSYTLDRLDREREDLSERLFKQFPEQPARCPASGATCDALADRAFLHGGDVA